jgi:hypothetical protein
MEPKPMESSSKYQNPLKPTISKQPARKSKFEVLGGHVDSDEEESLTEVDAGFSSFEKVYSPTCEDDKDRVSHLKLTTHVAGHLKSLAFISLRYFDDEESASVESQEIALGAGAEELSS